MAHLAHKRNRFQPAEAFFDSLPLSWTENITGMTRGAAINRAATRPRMILRDMRRHLQIPLLFHKSRVSNPLSPPSVSGCVPGSFSSMISAASRSAVPLP